MDIKTVQKIKPFANPEEFCFLVTDKNDKEYSVPNDKQNTDYQAIQQWVADGNTIQEAE